MKYIAEVHFSGTVTVEFEASPKMKYMNVRMRAIEYASIDVRSGRAKSMELTCKSLKKAGAT